MTGKESCERVETIHEEVSSVKFKMEKSSKIKKLVAEITKIREQLMIQGDERTIAKLVQNLEKLEDQYDEELENN